MRPSANSGILGLSGVAGDRNAKRLKEMQVLRRKGSAVFRFSVRGALAGIDRAGRLLLHFVQPDGGFQHEQNFKALPANIGHDAGNLRGLGNALVDGFSQLLNQLTEFLIQVRTSISRLAAWARNIRLSYLIF